MRGRWHISRAQAVTWAGEGQFTMTFETGCVLTFTFSLRVVVSVSSLWILLWAPCLCHHHCTDLAGLLFQEPLLVLAVLLPVDVGSVIFISTPGAHMLLHFEVLAMV